MRNTPILKAAESVSVFQLLLAVDDMLPVTPAAFQIFHSALSQQAKSPWKFNGCCPPGLGLKASCDRRQVSGFLPRLSHLLCSWPRPRRSCLRINVTENPPHKSTPGENQCTFFFLVGLRQTDIGGDPLEDHFTPRICKLKSAFLLAGHVPIAAVRENPATEQNTQSTATNSSNTNWQMKLNNDNRGSLT